ncbi:hypothetical protein [Roseicyclus sp.]|jgi:hypothetical protein
MDERIDPDLFARLMRFHSSARKDLLEYMGQGPVSVPPVLRRAAPVPTAARPADTTDTP